MRRSQILLATAGVLVTIQSHAASGLAGGVQIKSGADQVMVRRNRLMPWRPLASAKVPDGADIRCDQPCRVQVDADNTISLSGGAVITSGSFFYIPLVADAPSLTPAHQVELREGTIEIDSPSASAMPLVVTMSGYDEHVAVRGGRAEIVLKGAKAAVGVKAGQARVGAHKAWITVPTGFLSTMSSRDKPSAPRALLRAPVWSGPEAGCVAGLAVSEPQGKAVVGGCWEKMREAASYQVELAKDAAFQHPVAAESVSTAAWSKVFDPGRYFARIRSVDADGIAGLSSGVRQLAVIPCVLPPGSSAYLEARTLVVPEGREISFGDPTGLELAIDNGGFTRAPSSIVMDREPKHELRFRLKDDPSSASTVYIAQRRALHANVELTPKKAQWPTDPIDIKVTLQDPSGQLDPSRIEAQMQVTLGLTALPAQWTRQGAVWSTHIDPRSVGGPAVIRVVAKDEYGTQIGRGFLEIDYKPQRVAAGD
ncbi:MAG TPA: hypothetical protein VJT73_14175 [Polyangiaceae bacterium]|nr:hypothetical protein [Polyangiaceae bacterium]